MQHASHADTNAHQGYNDDNKVLCIRIKYIILVVCIL